MTSPQHGRPPVPLSQLVTLLRCPLCGKGFYGLHIDVLSFRADMTCQRKCCPQHWWAMRLHAGAVLPQLAEMVGEELAPALMDAHALPDSIGLPMFWQLSLTGSQAHHRATERAAGRIPAPPLGAGAPRRPA